MATTKPLKAEEVARIHERQEDAWRVKMILLFSLVVTAFLPFLVFLPLVIFSIWRRDLKDFRGDYVRKVDKRYLWTVLLIPFSFIAFYFLVFPFIPPNDIPIWGIYPSIVFMHNIILNILFFAVSAVALILLMLELKKYLAVKYHPLQKYKDSTDYLVVPTQTHGSFIFDRINTGIMVVGAPGSGKTEWIKQIVYQLPNRDDYAWIIFDPKGDYLEEFGNKDKDIVLAVEGGNYAWNLFWEIDIDDPEDPVQMARMIDDIKEIASELLSDEGMQEKYWIDTARQIFFAVVYIMMRESIEMYLAALEDYENGRTKDKPEFRDFLPTNQDLVNYLNSADIRTTYEKLKEYKEVRGIAEHINPESEKQAVGVWSVLQTNIEKLFIGSFGRSAEYKQMSIREYIADPKGRKLFIEYDVSHGNILGPVYRVLIDRAIKYSFARENKYGKDGKIRNKYFLIDEFQNVPKLNLYQNLVNYGRSFHLTSVIGIQSLAQVDVAYKKELTEAVVAGHGYVFSFRAWDDRTSKFILERIGKKQFWHYRPVQSSSSTGKGSATIGGEYQLTEYYPLSEKELRTFRPGECVIITPDGYKKVRLYLYKDGKEIIKKIKRLILRLKLIDAKRRELKNAHGEKAKKIKREIRMLVRGLEKSTRL